MTYSLESTIVDNFESILQRLELTRRMEDFYDIYYLARTFDFDGARLQTAIARTLTRCGTPMIAIASSWVSHLPRIQICRSV